MFYSLAEDLAHIAIPLTNTDLSVESKQNMPKCIMSRSCL